MWQCNNPKCKRFSRAPWHTLQHQFVDREYDEFRCRGCGELARYHDTSTMLVLSAFWTACIGGVAGYAFCGSVGAMIGIGFGFASSIP